MSKNSSLAQWARKNAQLLLPLGIAAVLGVAGLYFGSTKQEAALVGNSINDALLLKVDDTGHGNNQVVSPGQSFDIFIAMVNKTKTKSSLKTWTLPNYKLGMNIDNPTAYGAAAARTPIASAVGPKGTSVFIVRMVAPMASGVYPVNLRMVQEGKEWFGESVALTFTVRPKQIDAAVADDSNIKEIQLYPGQSKIINLAMRNKTDRQDVVLSTWDSNFALGTDNFAYGQEATRTRVSGTVTPTYYGHYGSEYYNFQVKMIAPVNPGVYDFKLQMVHENVAWFGPEVHVKITVVDVPKGVCASTSGSDQIAKNSYQLYPGQEGNFTAEFTNTSNETWYAGYSLSEHNFHMYQDTTVAGNKIFSREQNNDIYLPLASDIAPGQSGKINVQVIGRTSQDLTPGDYVIPVALYADYKGQWTGQYTSQKVQKKLTSTCVIRVKVVPPPYVSKAIADSGKLELFIPKANGAQPEYFDTKNVFTPGQTITFSAGFINTSDAGGFIPAWKYAAKGVFLAAKDSRTAAVDDILHGNGRINEEVKPGANKIFTRAFTYSIADKAAPGNYKITLQLRSDYGRFGDIIEIPYTIVARNDNATCSAASTDVQTTVNTPVSLSFTVQNTGNTYFDSSNGGYRLWPVSQQYLSSVNPIAPQNTVAPGASSTFTPQLTFAKPGVYTIEYQMSPGYLIFFGQKCSATVTVQ